MLLIILVGLSQGNKNYHFDPIVHAALLCSVYEKFETCNLQIINSPGPRGNFFFSYNTFD